ncbi:hypothetical protein V8E55_008311 [Tylopilus felleus]
MTGSGHARNSDAQFLNHIGRQCRWATLSELQVYRCRVLWDSRRAIIIPCILWFFTLVLGILAVWVSSVPADHPELNAPVGVAYCSVTVFLGATLASLIFYRHALRRVEGQVVAVAESDVRFGAHWQQAGPVFEGPRRTFQNASEHIDVFSDR